MFYSTETIGARTTGLHRKAVLEVSVEKTCGTIKDPPGAPIALRLQGTLLYGTVRIYQEQCRYVLNDSEKTQRAMSKLYSGMLDDKLDKNAGKTKSVQIILPNDPSFDLDLFQLPPFNFDEPLDGSLLSQDRQASWTTMSLKSHSSQNTQLPQLILDADSSAGGSHAGAFRYSASGGCAMPESPTPLAQCFDFQDEDNLLLDVGLIIDENGNIIEEEPQTEPHLPECPPSFAKNAGGNVVPMIVDDDDDVFNPNLPVYAVLDGKPRSTAALVDQGQINPSLVTDTPTFPSTPSTSTVVSRQADQKVSRAKVSFVDDVTQIPLSDYFKCVTNYSDNMGKVAAKKILARAMFSGEALAESLLGDSLTKAKRRRMDVAEPSTPIARSTRGINLDGPGDEQDIELGRMPGSALSDNPSLALHRQSSVLPGSSAHGSVQRSASAVRQHADGRLSSLGLPDSPGFFERYSDEDLQLPSQVLGSGRKPIIPSVGSFGAAGAGAGTAMDAARIGGLMNADFEKVGEEVRNVSVFYDLIRIMADGEGIARPELSSTYRWIEFSDVVSPFRSNRAAVVGAFMSLLTLTTARKLRIHQYEGEGDVLDRDIFIGVKPKKRVDRKGKGKMKDKKQSKKRGIHEISSDLIGDDIDELASDQIFSSPMLKHTTLFRGSELIGAA
ncbi:MAG: R8 protein [Sporothrix thermara]